MQEHIFHTALFLLIYLFIFYLCCSKLHTIKKAFPNGFAPVLLDSAYWNTLSAEPKLLPQDDRNLLYNSPSNSGTYCSCFSVPQTRIQLTETTSALNKTPTVSSIKTCAFVHSEHHLCGLTLPPHHHFPPFSSSLHPSFQSTFPCAGGNPCPASSLRSVRPATRYITLTEHASQPAFVSVSLQRSIRLAVVGGGQARTPSNIYETAVE